MTPKTDKIYSIAIRVPESQKMDLEEIQSVLAATHPRQFTVLGRLVVWVIKTELLKESKERLKQTKGMLRKKKFPAEHLSPAVRCRLKLDSRNPSYVETRDIKGVPKDEGTERRVALAVGVTPRVRLELDVISNLRRIAGAPSTYQAIISDALAASLRQVQAEVLSEAQEMVRNGNLQEEDFSGFAAMALGLTETGNTASAPWSKEDVTLSSSQLRQRERIESLRQSVLEIPTKKTILQEALQLGLNALEQRAKTERESAVKKKWINQDDDEPLLAP